MKNKENKKFYNYKHILHPKYWVNDIINIFASVVSPKYWSDAMLKSWLNRRYNIRMGKYVDFNNPESFNEKIQWYKIYYRNPVMSEIVDKIKFKKYVEKKLGKGYTPAVYATWYKYEEVNFSNLTPPYVIKSNCCSNGHNILFILNDDFDEKEVRNEIKVYLDKNNTYVHRSICGDRYAYWNVKPAVLVEEYLPSAHIGATDYKFFCFDGVPQCIVAIDGRFDDDKSETRYDMDWNMVNLSCNNDEVKSIPKPKHFDEMREIACKLSADFPFVRVDFYDTDEKPVLGEMTFYSGGGYNHYNPESYDYELGKLFTLRKH